MHLLEKEVKKNMWENNYGLGKRNERGEKLIDFCKQVPGSDNNYKGEYRHGFHQEMMVQYIK